LPVAFFTVFSRPSHCRCKMVLVSLLPGWQRE
jgi:hypothetical protein